MRLATAAIACTIPVILSSTTLISSTAQDRGASARSASAGPKARWTVPRTPWGDPDLNGVYSNDDETGSPFQRAAQFERPRKQDNTPAGQPAIHPPSNAPIHP